MKTKNMRDFANAVVSGFYKTTFYKYSTDKK